MRALYLGASIKVLKVDFENRGVDSPEDVPVVEKLLRKRLAKNHPGKTQSDHLSE